jgi:hypothetical protein
VDLLNNNSVLTHRFLGQSIYEVGKPNNSPFVALESMESDRWRKSCGASEGFRHALTAVWQSDAGH